MKQLILVSAGGALGTAARFLIQKLFLQLGLATFPLSTLSINIAGSFIIGLVSALVFKENMSSDWGLFLMTGICGGFTTFSTFSAENLALIEQNRFAAFSSYAVLSLAGGLLAAYLGQAIGK